MTSGTPEDAQAAFDKALALQRQGRAAEAAAGYDAILARWPDHLFALCCLSLCRLDLGRRDAALALARRAVAMGPASAESWHCLANVQVALGDLPAAISSFARLLALRPLLAETHHNLGKALLADGRAEEALKSLQAAVLLKPDFADACSRLGDALSALGRPAEAARHHARALAIDPANADARFGLGNSLAALKRHDQAIRCYRRALALRPLFAEACNNLGNALQLLGRAPEATLCFQQAIAIRPDFATPYNSLGSALQADERMAHAERCYRRATLLAPSYAEAFHNLGIVLTETGRLKAAFDAFETAVGLDPHRGAFYRMLAEAGTVGPDDPHVRRMEALMETALPDDERMELHFALGKVLGDAGRHHPAFRHLLAGNRLKRQAIDYDEAGTLAQLARIRHVFSAERIAAGAAAGDPARLPVFVVGMPRSGTTLVEQILASHEDVFGAGEIRDLPRLVKALPPPGGPASFPEIVAALPAERLRRLGDDYLTGLRARAPDAVRIVDKMLANFKRVGLIHMALPGARILHVRRDPLDTCLACFSKLFASSQAYAYDLGELGRYYRAYDALMAHWRDVLPDGVMLEVRYEDVVADVEGQARRLLAHCGLPWDDRCLAFHRTDRLVRTASAAQVRRPLYQSSVGRWHVYGDLARPLIEALEAQ